MCRRSFFLIFFIVFMFGVAVSTSADLIVSFEPDETNLTVTPAVWDTGLTVAWPVQGGTGGVPAATEGDYVLKMIWTGETDGKVQIELGNLSFDLAGEDILLIDVYMTSQLSPTVIGIWDDVFEWHAAISAPPEPNEWYTLELDVSSCNQLGLDHIAALVFEGMPVADGTIYVDNIRLGYDAPQGVVATGHDSRIDLRWAPVTHSGLQGYNIYCAKSVGGPFTKLNSSLDDITVYSNYLETNGLTKYYYVTLVINGIESNPSSIVSAATYAMTENQLLTSVQEATFRYFWDFGHPVSGMTRERSQPWDRETVTTGGSGFGLMAIIVGVERGFITRSQAADRILKILTFLQDTAPRYHGAWSHWMNGTTGEPIAFDYDDHGNPIISGDLVETSFMIQGMFAVRQYFDYTDPVEKEIRSRITQMWEEVEWDWYRRAGDTNGNSLWWFWSPTHGWQKSFTITGYNECMITYLLAVASPTHPIPASCYYDGWAGAEAYGNSGTYYCYRQWVGGENEPRFFVHYSYLGFDPRNKTDGYCNYFYNCRNNTLIDRAYCIDNPGGYTGYSDLVWGLTSSLDPFVGYAVHAPGARDNGTIAPTAAISSMPYTPYESIATLKHFYYTYGNSLWGPFGFLDAFNLTESWISDGYIAINQGPIIVMIENYRTELCWDLFMANSEIQSALDAIGWTILDPENFVLASYEPDETDLTATPAPWDNLTVTWPVQGGVGGVPVATEGSYVLKLEWTGENDRKVEMKQQWSGLTFDLAGYDVILADVYIATTSALPGLVGIWDDVFKWNKAPDVPTTINEWFTVSVDISSYEYVCLDHISAFVFEDLAGDNGTIYIDNLRINKVGVPCIFTAKITATGQSITGLEDNISIVSIGIDTNTLVEEIPPTPHNNTVVLTLVGDVYDLKKDIRATGAEEEEWQLSIVVGGHESVADPNKSGYFPVLSWNPDELCPSGEKTGYTELWSENSQGLRTLLIPDMTKASQYQTKKEDGDCAGKTCVFTYYIIWSKHIQVEMNFSAGWSMMSLPLMIHNSTPSKLFPEAAVIYSYEKGAGYVRIEDGEKLEVGSGYWILFYEDQNHLLRGQPINSYCKTVNESGWEMIGGCTSGARPTADSCDIDVIYKYTKGVGYQPIPNSEDLKPAEGFWILIKEMIDQCQLKVEACPSQKLNQSNFGLSMISIETNFCEGHLWHPIIKLLKEFGLDLKIIINRIIMSDKHNV